MKIQNSEHDKTTSVDKMMEVRAFFFSTESQSMLTSSEIINLNNVMSRQARSRWRNLTAWVSRPIIQIKLRIQSKTVASRSLHVHLQETMKLYTMADRLFRQFVHPFAVRRLGLIV